ncbi:MAG TPA: GNAT family N-acetyltransferase [Kofleriaceae bacterium]
MIERERKASSAEARGRKVQRASGSEPPVSVILAAVTELEESNRQFVEAWRLFARAASGGIIESRDGLEIAFAGLALPLVNMMFLSSPVRDAGDLRRRLDAAATFGRSRGVPWMFTLCEDWLPADAAAEAPAILAAAGLAPMTAATGMVADELAPPRRAAPPALDLRSADGTAAYRELSDLNMIAYSMPVEWGHEAFAREGLFRGGDIWPDIGYLDGTAVSTSTTALVDGRLYVMMVATAADHRNRGYAEAVMRRSLARAEAATGIRRTVLHASPAGAPLYAAMGYRSTGRFTMYIVGTGQSSSTSGSAG